MSTEMYSFQNRLCPKYNFHIDKWQYVFGIVLSFIFLVPLCPVKQVASMRVDLSLEKVHTGFFLKPLSQTQGIREAYGGSEHFVITHPEAEGYLKAEYSNFSSITKIPATHLYNGLRNQSSMLNNIVVKETDITAHLVTRTITLERPLLQVLFHGSRLSTFSHQRPSQNETLSISSNAFDHTKWCLHMHVTKGIEEHGAVCVLTTSNKVCIADLFLPHHWWDSQLTESADVYYSVYGIDDKLQCTSTSDSFVPGKLEDPSPLENYRRFISPITLTHGQMTYQELKEDQHILIYMPQKSFYPGSKLKVPVKLQAESDLQMFVMKVKARHGVRVVGAELANPDRWQIALDINNKKRGAIITAYIHDKKNYSKVDRVQEIFDWVLEVEEEATKEDIGRITMSVEYQMNTQMQETYGMVENKIVSRIQIQHDNTYAIVPVVKAMDITNTAILTGKTETYSMFVYSISHTGKVSDITAQTTCHSGDEQVLKVDHLCTFVYLDGSETKGSPSVSVIAKYGRHTKFLFFRVWIPQIPLEIELSDNKLSQVRRWKVPTRSIKGNGEYVFEWPSHSTWPHTSGELNKESVCDLKFQQSTIEVYARFFVSDGTRGDQYLVHKKAMFKVTGLVSDKIRIADNSIAVLNGVNIEGLRPGRTEIQVMSQNGVPIAAKEFKVGGDRVEIEKMHVNVVSGIKVQIKPEVQMPGTFKLTTYHTSDFKKQKQEAVLDITLTFDDGTFMPLKAVDNKEYSLHVDTLNIHVVGPVPNSGAPRIIAFGPGKGELLKVSLESTSLCNGKKSKPLALSYVYINVDFSKRREEFQSDDSKMMSWPENKYQYSKIDSINQAKGSKYGGNIDMTLSEGENEPAHEAQQQAISASQRLTRLEVGMYVLLGIFCLAITIFLVINTSVFIARYKKKKILIEKKDPISNANDWVWIGRATLERNAINTHCQQALMPESDFNGNRSRELNFLCAKTKKDHIKRSSTYKSPRPNSNRDSMTSTYKGSECSIRITANPQHDLLREKKGHHTVPRPHKPNRSDKEVHRHSEDLQSSTKAKCALSKQSKASPTLSPNPKHRELIQQAVQNAREQDVANGNFTDGSLTDVEWDYEAMGLTYEQLMEYFDNLKESTA